MVPDSMTTRGPFREKGGWGVGVWKEKDDKKSRPRRKKRERKVERWKRDWLKLENAVRKVAKRWRMTEEGGMGRGLADADCLLPSVTGVLHQSKWDAHIAGWHHRSADCLPPRNGDGGRLPLPLLANKPVCFYRVLLFFAESLTHRCHFWGCSVAHALARFMPFRTPENPGNSGWEVKNKYQTVCLIV